MSNLRVAGIFGHDETQIDDFYRKIISLCNKQKLAIHDFKSFTRMSMFLIKHDEEKLEETTYLSLSSNKNLTKVSDIFEEKKASSPVVEKIENKIRGFVQIQNGCDHRCTFCIIPYGRGNSRSVEPLDVVNQIKILVKKAKK